MELSKRLQAVADLAGSHPVVADVGTDHGYIPIYLVERKKCERALALDVNEGPLERARRHIMEHDLLGKIEVRQSDGVKALQPGECDCAVLAGMGGALTVKILEEGEEIFRDLKDFVLQPQSEIAKVRHYLAENHYLITAEDMVLEEGKFYPMMKVKVGQAAAYSRMELRYGRDLLRQKHPVLEMFLEKEVCSKEQILKNLESVSGEQIRVRRQEIKAELLLAKEALEVYL